MYADIVIDISHESLDRPFQYRIPESLVGQVQPGMWVLVPFGRRNTQKKGFVLNEIDGEYIVAATGRRSRTFGGYICLNHTGKFLWDIISKGTEKDTLYKKFAEEFGIDYTTAKDDADAFLSKLEGADIIER